MSPTRPNGTRGQLWRVPLAPDVFTLSSSSQPSFGILCLVMHHSKTFPSQCNEAEESVSLAFMSLHLILLRLLSCIITFLPDYAFYTTFPSQHNEAEESVSLALHAFTLGSFTLSFLYRNFLG